MDKNDNYLVYLCVGSDLYQHQLLYSIASLYQIYKGKRLPRIIVYTDDVENLEHRLPEETLFESLTPEILQKFQNGLEYIPRVKIEIIKNAAKKYKGNIVFVDLDTCFLKPIDEIYKMVGAGHFFLHINEGNIEERAKRSSTAKKVKNGINKHRSVLRQQDILIEPGVEMWNSGVVGFNSQQSMFLDDVLHFIDVFYALTGIWVTEQLGVSYRLNEQVTILGCEEYVYHYHHFKEFKETVLADFFEYHKTSKLNEFIKDIGKIDPRVLIKPQLEYKQLSEIKKGYKVLTTGRKWQLPEYKFWEDNR